MLKMEDITPGLVHLTAHGGKLPVSWAALAMTVAGKRAAPRRNTRMKRIMMLNKQYSSMIKESDLASAAWKRENTEEMRIEILQALHSSPSLVGWV